MIKKLNLLRMLIMLSFLTLFVLSCRKDGGNDENLTEAQRIANAKNWYQKATAKIELKAGSKVENVSQEISWADAKLYKEADGNEIIAVPVDIKLNSGATANGSYLLMISKTGNTYKPVISFNEKKNYFENIVSAKIKDLYSDAIKPNNKNTVLNNTNKGKVMAVDGAMDCVAWYLTETYYDEEGNVIQYYEHFMYEICQALIDGSSEPTEPPCTPGGYGDPSSVQLSSSETEEVIGIDSFKVYKPIWKFHNSITFWYESHDRFALKIKNGIRTWHSMTHRSTEFTGIYGCGEVELISPVYEPIIWNETNPTASMSIEYKLKFINNQQGQIHIGSFTTPKHNSVATWDKYGVKQ